MSAAGHDVTVPDLFEGALLDSVDEGVGHAQEIGFGTVVERGRLAVERRPDALVVVGLSLGVLRAQQIARARPGVLGALLLHGCVPPSEFGGWPPGLPARAHAMDGDELGDVDVARALAAAVAGVEQFLHPGDAHLFTDTSLPVHDAAATDLVVEWALAFLARVG